MWRYFCFQYCWCIHTIQKPSYLNKITLISIWRRMMLTQIINQVYTEPLILIYPPISKFDNCITFQITMGEVLSYQSWCWFLILCNHLYSGPTLGQTSWVWNLGNLFRKLNCFMWNHTAPSGTLTYNCEYVQVVVAVGVSLGKFMGDLRLEHYCSYWDLCLWLLFLLAFWVWNMASVITGCEFVLCPWQWFVSWCNLHSGSVRQAWLHCSRNGESWENLILVSWH
jgi:hypothetical protein